jgi:hypothetical protein
MPRLHRSAAAHLPDNLSNSKRRSPIISDFLGKATLWVRNRPELSVSTLKYSDSASAFSGPESELSYVWPSNLDDVASGLPDLE